MAETIDPVRALRDRAAVLGEESAEPAITLAAALRAQDRIHESIRALDEGRARRPNDPLLDLALAEYRAAIGDEAGADHLLELARERAAPLEFARSEATVAEFAGRDAEALAAWRRVREQQPVAWDAHRAIVRLDADLAGAEPATMYWRAIVEQFPFVTICRLELAKALSRAGAQAEALAECAAARADEPAPRDAWRIEAAVHLAAGRPVEAANALQQALECSVNDAWAVAQYCDLAVPAEVLRVRVAWVRERLEAQHAFGEGLAAWVAPAKAVLDPGTVRSLLQQLLVARPDVPQVWSLLIAEQLEAGETAEAVTAARLATERFPMVPHAWSDLAAAHRAAGYSDRCDAAAARARKFTPARDRR